MMQQFCDTFVRLDRHSGPHYSPSTTAAHTQLRYHSEHHTFPFLFINCKACTDVFLAVYIIYRSLRCANITWMHLAGISIQSDLKCNHDARCQFVCQMMLFVTQVDGRSSEGYFRDDRRHPPRFQVWVLHLSRLIKALERLEHNIY